MDKPLRVLIAEDNPLDAKLVLRELHQAGYKSEWQRVDSEAAFLAELHNNWDIILSDFMIPEFGGMRALELLKASGLDIPFIIVSGTMGEEEAVAAMKRGATDYLLKDRTARLGVAVEHALAEKKLRTERQQAESEVRRSAERFRQLSQRQDAILNALSGHIALLDPEGIILSVNEAWRRFAVANGLRSPDYYVGHNYLSVCDHAMGAFSEEAGPLAEGIRKVNSGELPEFALEYPCHSPTEKRWFRVTVTPLDATQRAGVVVMHINITVRKLAEEKMQASELRYRRLFEAAKDGVVILDAETGKIVDVNPFLLMLLDYTHADLMGKQLWEIGCFQDIIANQEAVRKLQAEKYIRYESLPLKTKEGRSIWVEFISNVYDVSGTKVIQCNIRDITDRKRAELEMQWKTALLEAQVNASIDGILVVDGEGKKQLQNQRMNELWKIPQHIADDINDEKQLLWVTNTTRNPVLFLERVVYLNTHPNEVGRDEIELKDGTILDRYSSPVIGKDGKLYGRIWTFRDITERKRATEQLKDIADRLSIATDAAKIGVWDWNLKTDEIVWDARVRDIYQVPKESLKVTYEQWEMSVHADDRAETVEQLRQTVANKGRGHRFFRIVLPDGSIRDIEAMESVIVDETQTAIRVVGVNIDITERKQVETALRKSEDQLRQSQKMDAIGQLAGGVAHDFNNQLNVIVGYAELLGERLTDPKLKRFANNIVTSAMRSADLTKNLLAFSRKGQFQAAPMAIHGILKETTEMLERTIDKRIKIKIALNAKDDVISGDPSQLQNAFLNLAVNARDAMPDGGTVELSTENVHLDSAALGLHLGEALPGDYLKICVRDTGTGMSDEVKRHLFEPFFTTKAVGKGTGMGLASVFGTVKNHKGLIDVYSELGHGTEFRIYLPMATQKPPAATSNSSLTAIKRNLRILLVEDEEILRQMFVEILNMGEHTSVEAGNGREAVDIYRTDWMNFDLVILDMIMPEMNGRDAFREMKKINPKIKALLATGFSLNTEVQSVLDEGVLGFIQKPFKPIDILQLITKVVTEN